MLAKLKQIQKQQINSKAQQFVLIVQQSLKQFTLKINKIIMSSEYFPAHEHLPDHLQGASLLPLFYEVSLLS